MVPNGARRGGSWHVVHHHRAGRAARTAQCGPDDNPDFRRRRRPRLRRLGCASGSRRHDRARCSGGGHALMAQRFSRPCRRRRTSLSEPRIAADNDGGFVVVLGAPTMAAPETSIYAATTHRARRSTTCRSSSARRAPTANQTPDRRRARGGRLRRHMERLPASVPILTCTCAASIPTALPMRKRGAGHERQLNSKSRPGWSPSTTAGRSRRPRATPPPGTSGFGASTPTASCRPDADRGQRG